MKKREDKVATSDRQRGLQCSACGHRRLRVVYTRAAKGGKLVRRRECRECGERISTWEQVVGDSTC
ncbi:transcriptional regulator NrdR [Symmachiella macrocystis]|uniref:Transcriptional regulator NrdR n=1 Tax=Symmachiella macrocystis TaxID=2527985 RepID=A0A5C6BNF4_9PLAN|nr:transcriptional regulator NrdR [Symmachiella macrocystis]